MRTKLVCIVVLSLICTKVSAQKYFMCFINDSNPKLALTVGFDTKTEKASFVKYKGQHETIPLTFVKSRVPNKGYATTETTYTEKYKGKATGTYTFTHSGNWDYITYIRKKDGKKFTFIVDHELSIIEGQYRDTPCY